MAPKGQEARKTGMGALGAESSIYQPRASERKPPVSHCLDADSTIR